MSSNTPTSTTNSVPVAGNFLQLLCTVIHNPEIIALFEGTLRNNIHTSKLLDQHMVACTINGRQCYKLFDVLFYGANNIVPYTNSCQCPQSIPHSALEELAITSQDDLPIAKLYGSPNHLLSLACNSKQELIAAFSELQAFICDTIFWLTSCINYSDDSISSPNSSPGDSPEELGYSTDVEMSKDSDTNVDINYIMEKLSCLSIDNDYVKMEMAAKLPMDQIMNLCTS
ncbi:hypothetical protein IW262DRAFT_1469082 [Armillaria fumosa]|nr:hypothetical protein IW262DRAFT_1469082 [Armillaria fumosa]